MPYRYLEEMATADVAFEAWGPTAEEMFRSAGDALMNVMVDDLNTIAARTTRTLSFQDDSHEMLLFQFLQELIYVKDAECLLLRARHLEIKQDKGRVHLLAQVYGETLDPSRHELVVDVKAVTLHLYSVEHLPGGWRAQVILDI
jgi:SHS2 domain-containing protein